MVALLDSAILRNLHLGRTTLYDLCDEDDEALPVIIAELAKHATNNENGVAAREGECELGTLAIGKRCQGTDLGDRMGRGSGQFAESALDTLYVARNRGRIDIVAF
jgi:hypothetical protein